MNPDCVAAYGKPEPAASLGPGIEGPRHARSARMWFARSSRPSGRYARAPQPGAGGGDPPLTLPGGPRPGGRATGAVLRPGLPGRW